MTPRGAAVWVVLALALARSRVAMTRRSFVTDDRRALDPLVFTPRGGRCAHLRASYDRGRIGIAGHSFGSTAAGSAGGSRRS